MYNILGKKLQVLYLGEILAGLYKYVFSTKDEDGFSGVYFVKLILNNEVQSRG
ncbi:MAG: hypothetical protein JKX73_11665 [Flavobacteriales bacterium]|nr:hypothetical protein [Flavobacteriales bacterium]